MNYALDRAVGKVTNAINSNGLANDTIIVYVSDNGGTNVNDNTPLRGSKGFTWEGGIRVPFTIKIPGLTPGQYQAPVSTYDLLPTLLTAAGIDVASAGIPTDGVNLLPYLSGQAVGNPHDKMFWRSFDVWAVRKGDWKLAHLAPGPTFPALFNLAADPNELNNQVFSQQAIAADLFRELTFWEATLAKPKFGPLSADTQNQFDHFVFRSDLATTTNFSAANMWLQAGTSNPASMTTGDPYANGIFEIPVRNEASFTANNDMLRLSRREFMLNQLRLSGNFTGATNQTGSITGNQMLFVKSLTGALPQIRLDATGTSAAKFTFNSSNYLQLLDDLEITGNGNQNFILSGTLTDYWLPRNVVKSGTSHLTLTGTNSFTGGLIVAGGKVTLAGPGVINGPMSIVIGNGATFTHEGGTTTVPTINTLPGGSFQFTGGELRVVNFTGNLINQGGNYSPGASPAASTITGNLVEAPGSKLTIELAGTNPGVNYDKLTITGTATLGGTLQANLLNGFIPANGHLFQILVANGGVTGMFANAILPALSGGLQWRIIYGSNNVELFATTPGGQIPGDFNASGAVDAADYVVWKDTIGTQVKYNECAHKSRRLRPAVAAATGQRQQHRRAVPEPSGLFLALLAGIFLSVKRRRTAALRSRSSQPRSVATSGIRPPRAERVLPLRRQSPER